VLECLAHYTRTFGGDGTFEHFFLRIEVVDDEQRLASLFLEGHRGHGPTVVTFVIGPD
jgi:hypothetical protein